MKRRACIFILLVGVVIGSGAQETNAVTNTAPAHVEVTNTADSFDAFKIIAQRNIFDPNRSAPGSRRRSEDRPKPIKIDYLNLVGAMSYEKGQFAFFDGSSSEYRKSVKAGDSIAGYKVAAVTQSRVTLENDGQKIELPVGGQLKRQDEGEWRVNTTAESFDSSSQTSSSTSTSSTSSSPETKSDGAGESDVLKRMLERRKKEQEK